MLIIQRVYNNISNIFIIFYNYFMSIMLTCLKDLSKINTVTFKLLYIK
jgi:CO dehydrogenase/acetyl-CoA synthase epsilon subunit